MLATMPADAETEPHQSTQSAGVSTSSPHRSYRPPSLLVHCSPHDIDRTSAGATPIRGRVRLGLGLGLGLGIDQLRVLLPDISLSVHFMTQGCGGHFTFGQCDIARMWVGSGGGKSISMIRVRNTGAD